MKSEAIAVISLIGLLACSSVPSSGSSTGGSGSGSGNSDSSGTAGGGASGGSGTGGGSTGTSTGGLTDAGDTWTTWASPQFFQPFCVSCHRPGGAGDPSGGKNFNLYQDVSANAGLIRCGVAVTQNADWNCDSAGIVPEQFPIGNGPLPDAGQRDRLVDWLDAGFPQ